MATADLANEDLAQELSERWVKQLEDQDWSKRLYLINDLYEYMRDTIPDFDVFCDVFPHTIAKILYRLGPSDITCAEQAHILANSGDAKHRDLAGEWFRQHRQRSAG